MSIRSPLLGALAALTLFTLGQFAAASDVLIPPKTMVFGSDSRGGGDTKAGKPVTPIDIYYLLTANKHDQYLRTHVAMFFNATSIKRRSSQLEFNFGPIPGVRKTFYSDLFLGRRDQTVQALVGQIPYEIQYNPQDPKCLEGSTVKVAVAYSNPNRICIDARIIAAHPGVNSMNMYSVVMAILVHEYSHYKGANEIEAQTLQEYALESTPTNNAFNEIDDDYRALRSIERIISETLVALIHNQSTTACYMLGILPKLLFPDNNPSLSTMSLQEFDMHRMSYVYADNVSFYCRQDPDALKFLNFAFGNSTEISGRKYICSRSELHGGDCSGSYYPEGNIRRINFGDKKELSTQLLSIKQMIQNKKTWIQQLEKMADK